MINYLIRFVLLSAGISLFSNTAAAQDWVPVYKEPKHQLVYENDQVLILDVNLPPGYVSLYHQHEMNLLYVTITGSKVTAQPLNGQLREADVKTGDLRFSADNHQLPHIHQVANIGETPFRVIGVGRKKTTPSSSTETEQADVSDSRPVMENALASVYRVSLEPGEKSYHRLYPLPFVLVCLTGGELIDSSGKAFSVKPGDFIWNEGGEMYSYKNRGSEEIEVIEMRWR